MEKTIAIIGGGAAGMMTAATILEQASFFGNILLFEKNSKLGAKVIISGGGRCNVTTGVFKRQELKIYYTRGGEFLDTAFRGFSPKQVRTWFEDHGVPLKQEADGRIFPVSDDGKDIVGVFEHIFMKDKRISVHFGEGVEKIQKEEDATFSILTNKKNYRVDAVVLTTGGNAYAHTGSSGDGYTFARACGHTITPLGPSLNSFMTKEPWMHDLSGMSFDDAVLRVTLSDEAGTCKDATGPVLLTHFGISGPATFVLASYTAFETIESAKPLFVCFQPLASMHIEERDKVFLEASHSMPKKQVMTILSTYLPKRFATAFVARYTTLDTTIGTLTKEERKKAAGLLGYGIPVMCVKRRPGDEFVTAGGVSLEEINPKTMESRVCPGLYFAGEIMDVDGVTGGFNLQASRAAGRLVGKNILT